MKKLFLLLFSTILLMSSCDKNEYEQTGSGNKEKALIKSSLTNGPAPAIDPLAQLQNHPLHIKVSDAPGVINHTRRFLSAQDENLAPFLVEKEMNGKQRWYIIANGDGSYKLKCDGDTKKGGHYLGRELANTNSIYIRRQDNSSTASNWVIKEHPMNEQLFTIELQERHNKNNASIDNNRRFMSVIANSSPDVFLGYDDKSGRQNWTIEPKGEFDIVDIAFFPDTDKAEIVNVRPKTYDLENPTNLSIKRTVKHTVSTTKTSRFSKTHGISYSIKQSASLSATVPGVSASGSIEVSRGQSWTFAEETSESRTESREITYEVTMPPNTSSVLEITEAEYEVSATYILTIRPKGGTALMKTKGRWIGIQGSFVKERLYDKKTNRELPESSIRRTEL